MLRKAAPRANMSLLWIRKKGICYFRAKMIVLLCLGELPLDWLCTWIWAVSRTSSTRCTWTSWRASKLLKGSPACWGFRWTKSRRCCSRVPGESGWSWRTTSSRSWRTKRPSTSIDCQVRKKFPILNFLMDFATFSYFWHDLLLASYIRLH